MLPLDDNVGVMKGRFGNGKSGDIGVVPNFPNVYLLLLRLEVVYVGNRRFPIEQVMSTGSEDCDSKCLELNLIGKTEPSSIPTHQHLLLIGRRNELFVLRFRRVCEERLYILLYALCSL